jgi:hypothetical protein
MNFMVPPIDSGFCDRGRKAGEPRMICPAATGVAISPKQHRRRAGSRQEMVDAVYERFNIDLHLAVARLARLRASVELARRIGRNVFEAIFGHRSLDCIISSTPRVAR